MVSAKFPYDSQFTEVHGSRMHYIEEGAGDPVLFLHGNPTSSYLWRNIIPHVSPHGRCIAPDLIGMGQSSKPELAYRFQDHYRYLEGFIEKLELNKITLVVHDWGSGLGFHYAHQNPGRIKGIAFMEAICRPMKWSQFPADFKMGFKLMRTPYIGWLMVSVMNIFVRQILPQAIVRELSAEEKRHYAAPFPSVKSRRPVRQWPCEIPIDGRPADVYEIVRAYGQWLQETDIPKLFFYAQPGGIIRKELAEWIQAHYPNLRAVNLGEGIHYLQEDHPEAIGRALSDWMVSGSE